MRRPWLICVALTAVSWSCAHSVPPDADDAAPPARSKESAKPVSEGPEKLTAKQIVERAKPAIVRVGWERGVGTGFVIAEGGVVATNLHVIAGASQITVELSDHRKFDVDRVLAVDTLRDLALVHIDATDLPVVALGDSDKVSAGEPVVIIGNPLGVLDFTVSDGLVSSVREVSEELTVIQTSAPISQGSSGGPLFNEYGQVIAVATFFSVEGQNLNFAIPSNYLRPMLKENGDETPAALAARLRESEPTTALRPTIPIHSLNVVAGCSPGQLMEVAEGIQKAIDVGAPVYNRGEHEACFVIYRSAAEEFAQRTSLCTGVRQAFVDGLTRARNTSGFTDKAWAMRDAFDGLVIIIHKRLTEGAEP